MIEQVIDYTKVKHMTFVKLEQLEKRRQGSTDGRLKNIHVKLLCDNCHEPFIRMLHDYRLAFGLTCSVSCLKALERKVIQEITNDMCGERIT